MSAPVPAAHHRGTEVLAAAPAETPVEAPLLEVAGLSVRYRSASPADAAVHDVSFSVRRGEILGLVGESGSGKSTVLNAILRLLPDVCQVDATRLEFDGIALSDQSPEAMRMLRGRRIALVPQRPMTSLSPVIPLGRQLRRLAGPGVDDARLADLLRQVGLGMVAERLDGYPFQLSGGQLQRVLITISALAAEPDLLLADEPTTTLDTTVQAQVLRLLLELRDRLGIGMVLVSHDLGVIAQTCDRVGVMHAGRIIELGSVDAVFAEPQHPYTRVLLRAAPQRWRRGERLLPDQHGKAPVASAPTGCAYLARCPHASDRCVTEAPELRAVLTSLVRCHHPGRPDPAFADEPGEVR
ncbi:ABC transporter ATP-binding protein [Yinghuangia seranimata]|uniref:ABC transporter ATP-binding protein n=1 Tax=Yinghuangia seranimata TaxID=408067 RepID=UPI00248A9207|nr:ABC transporter ATP-binding protein [Yinghuangia seranimata]MDI2124967.1 ABC transporter ATP-binding protein [Yinghuangia seranimata]